jgi:hypothetical protein
MKPKPLVVLNHLTVPIAIVWETLRQVHRATALSAGKTTRPLES